MQRTRKFVKCSPGPSPNRTVARYSRVSDLELEAFLDNLIGLCCARYVNEGHTPGYLHTFLQHKATPLAAYLDDTEHGLFHGICAAYVATVLDGKGSAKDEAYVRTVASCLVHDFVRCTDPSTAETHDALLRDVFPNLDECTYTHSNPPDPTPTLVRADRVELMRYPDHPTWVDDRLRLLLAELPLPKRQLLQQFYSTQRPALLFFYRALVARRGDASSVLVRHGLECNGWEADRACPKWPPTGSYMPFCPGGPRPAFAVETSALHGGMGDECFDHDPGSSWDRIQGWVSLRALREGGGRLVADGTRDHLVCSDGDLERKDWVFTYNSELKVTTPDDVQILEERCERVVSKAVARKFCRAVEKLIGLLVCSENAAQAPVDVKGQ